ncbi:MAG: alpha/beta hydrolase [Myxococcales bacterium]|nr:alpha/beta hydrolase [Myxococcales bacterium]
MSFLPAHDLVGPDDAFQTAFVMHGILGNRRNLGSLVRRLSAEHPDWRFVNVDLRNHGDSDGAPGPHTLRACAEDLDRLAQAVGRPRAVIGHSYGGKVALVYARDFGVGLRTVWSLDTTFGTGAEAVGQGREVAQVIAHAKTLPQPAPSRDAVVAHFKDAGFSDLLARWMTTNVHRAADGFRWRFDLAAIEAMFADYWRCDLWPFLEAAPPSLRLNLLRAGRSDRWTPDIVARLASLHPRVRSPVLDTGHWVHVEDPDGLLALLSASLDE